MLCGLSGPAQVLLGVFSWPPATCCPENGIPAPSPACCGTWENYLPSRVFISMSGPATRATCDGMDSDLCTAPRVR